MEVGQLRYEAKLCCPVLGEVMYSAIQASPSLLFFRGAVASNRGRTESI